MGLQRIIACFFICLAFCYVNAQTHPLISSFEDYKKHKESTPFHLKASLVGPVLNSARCESIQADPKNPSTIYAAFGSGGLWKTINNGMSWQAIFEGMPTHGIGDIALAPSDSDIIYVGTGESLRKRRNFTIPGTGIYRSDDAGSTWNHIGLEDSWHIGEIAIHPTDPDIVFVAVMGKFWSPSETKGIYRTDNGGKSWTQVLYVDENTRANDVVIAPSNPDVVYASMWETNYDENIKESVYGKQSSVYKSTDGGLSWKKIGNGLPNGNKTGRIGIAVSYQDENKVYALVDNLNKNREKSAEIYRTDNGGANWKRTHNKDLQFHNVIGWYFTDIYVNPNDHEEVFALGVRLMHSTDGGQSFDKITGHVRHLNPSAADYFHLDQCELWINPSNTNNIIAANDGGVYQSYDKGKSWLHYNNIPVGEFYDITVTQRKDYTIYGGTQDNATVYGPARELNNEFADPWRYLWIDAWSGGDGCVTVLDPDDTNTIYFSMQNGAGRRMDRKNDTSVNIIPKFDKFDSRKTAFNFISPYIVSKYDSKVLYHGGNYVFRSDNKGDNWFAISEDLSKSKYPDKKSTAAGAIAESALDKDLLYVGMDHGSFWYTDDGAKSWTEASEGLANGYIRSITPSKYDTNLVYITMTGLNYDDLNSYIYSSTDNGNTWQAINSNLPAEPVNVLMEDPNYPDILYAGTHRSVYISMNKGDSWQMLAKNLPSVSIADLDYNEYNRELVIATHGRAIYTLDLKGLHQAIDQGRFSNSDNKRSIQLFQISNIKAPKRRNTHRDVDLTSLRKANIFYWSSDEQFITFSIVNKDNEKIFSKKILSQAGLNQFTWNLIIEKIESDSPYATLPNKYISAGRYQMTISNGKESMTKPLFIEL